MSTSKRNVKKVPPDGGWGWMIIVGFTICGVRKLKTILYTYIALCSYQNLSSF